MVAAAERTVRPRLRKVLRVCRVSMRYSFGKGGQKARVTLTDIPPLT